MQKELMLMFTPSHEAADGAGHDPEPLLDDVLELMLSWHAHVSHAEGRAGLHSFLCTSAPRYLSMIPHLRERHRAVFGRIDGLRRRLANGERGLFGAEYSAILEEIAVHDDLETELLMDAIENP